jgi:adenine-specific DNA-methyltransferase
MRGPCLGSPALILAKREPLRAVFRDAGFVGDSVKINVEQIFKLMSHSTEAKTI